MLGEILSSFTIFPDKIIFDSLKTGATNSLFEFSAYTVAFISLLDFSSSEMLMVIVALVLFFITATIVGVDKKAINMNNNMRATSFIETKITLNK